MSRFAATGIVPISAETHAVAIYVSIMMENTVIKTSVDAHSCLFRFPFCRFLFGEDINIKWDLS